MNIKQTIFILSETPGASGSETEAANAALEMLKETCPDARIENGCVIGSPAPHREGLEHLVIDAHIDQIGLIVTAVTETGFIKFSDIGGIDRRILPCLQVKIHGKCDITGVICSVPPHLSDGGEKIKNIDEMAIDAGLTAEKAKEIISPGDSITFDTKCMDLIGNRMTGGALDDRCAVAGILYAMELIRGKKLKYNVTVLFSTQEELGERGAKISAYNLEPDVALAVDVSFGYAQGESEVKCGHLSEGPMIGISPSLSREISDKLVSVAKKSGIPYQIEVMNGLTSTNADCFSVSRKGAKTCTVSIPLRYMHTPVEVIDLRDVELTGKLLAAFITEDKI